MTTTGPSSYKVVKHDDKIEVLKTFIAAAADRIENGLTRAVAGPTLIARSPESPVAQAFLNSNHPIFSKIAPRIVFTQSVANIADLGLTGPMVASLERQFRVLTDIRYLDAHEQLVLSADCSWIGDCMRRDPMKRDAFEKFAAECAATAGFAAVSFERFWRAARPLPRQTAPREASQWSKATDGADSLAATAVPGDLLADRPAPAASTRH